MKKSNRPSRPQARKATGKRGAQPGNHNALTHGFYSSIFKDRERELLSKVPLTDLSSEIGLIRISTKRFLETLTSAAGSLDLDTQLTALRAINLSVHSIATLFRAHALAFEDPLDDADAFPGELPGTLDSDPFGAPVALDPARTDASPDPEP